MSFVINEDPKKINRPKLRYLFRRIVRRIKDKPRGYFMFKKMRGTWGLYEFDDGITLDPRRDVISTLLHEVLHDIYPNNNEMWIVRMERKIMNVISSYDIYNLLTAFFQKLDIGPNKRAPKAKRGRKIPRAGRSRRR